MAWGSDTEKLHDRENHPTPLRAEPLRPLQLHMHWVLESPLTRSLGSEGDDRRFVLVFSYSAPVCHMY